MLRAIVVVAPDERGRQRKGVRLRFWIELRERFFEPREPAGITDRYQGVAHLDLEGGAPLGRRRLGERTLEAFNRCGNHAARFVDVADFLVDRGDFVGSMQRFG